MAVTTFTVVGMTCDHCVRAVQGEVAKLEGVERVDVDLSSGQVVIEGAPVTRTAVAAAVDEAGYELAPAS